MGLEKYLNFDLADLLVPADQRSSELEFADLKKLGEAADSSMRDLGANGPTRETALLAVLTLAEYAVRLHGYGAALPPEVLVAPLLDLTLEELATGSEDALSPTVLESVRPWLFASKRYWEVVSALMNAAQGRMRGVRAPSGVVVFEPTSALDAELRNRWFLVLWQAGRQKEGVELAANMDESAIPRVDAYLAANRSGTAFETPSTDWWTDRCDPIADAALERQFSDIDPAEVWGWGWTAGDFKSVLRPLYRWAAAHQFAQTRACVLLRAEGRKGPDAVPSSLVLRVSRPELIARLETSGRSKAGCERLADAITRSGSGERHGPLRFPLIPLAGDELALMPSHVLLSNWALVLQDATKQDAVGSARCKRHTQAVADFFDERGFDTRTDLEIFDVNGDVITDLDVVVHDPGNDLLLVLQLKSFVPQPNLMDLQKNDRYAKEAKEQCEKARDNWPAVEAAMAREGLTVTDRTTLRQCIVVESVGPTFAMGDEFPWVPVGWVTESAALLAAGGLQRFWEEARDLDAAADFFDGVAPLYSVVDLTKDPPAVGEVIAVLDYRTSPTARP